MGLHDSAQVQAALPQLGRCGVAYNFRGFALNLFVWWQGVMGGWRVDVSWRVMTAPKVQAALPGPGRCASAYNLQGLLCSSHHLSLLYAC
jgi:hypothetical protein